MIKCLPKEVQGKLRSGVAIPSLQQCLEELILNSIDAEATCVGVRMDMEALKVQVIDNGAGVSAEDMERVGNRYYTSKCNSLEDLDDLRWYGFRGEALASIVSLATLVEISSRTRSTVKTHVKIFKNGKGLDVFEAETTRPSAGTTVVICNFFHNMPVRRKRMDAVLEGERIRHRVEAISLMHPSVSFTLKNDCTGAMMVQLPKAKNTYHRFVQIHSLVRAQKLGEISYTHGQFEVTGYIGREGHYNNSLQFLYVNGRLLLKTRIHKLLNFLLRRLSSSNQKCDSPDGQSAIRSPKHKRSQELHGVYIINIKCPYSEYDICLEPAKTLIEFKDWDGILLCIEEAVKAFLSRENLVAVLSQDDLDYVSPQLFSTDSTDQEGNSSDKGGQAASSASTLDCSIGMKLASESVHRKRKDDCVSEDGVCQESGLMECKDGEAEKMPADDLEKKQSEGKECRDEPQCQLEPASDDNITEEEEPTFSKAEEGSQIMCMSRPDNTCLSSGDDIQDSNNNENPCDTALNSELVSGCNTNPQSGEKEEDTGDWLHHYDTSVGKTVYVNRVTGLSKYEDPSTEDTQVRCSSDVTNMAVSVVSETGMEHRCYPFQVDVVLPFLPKSRTGRVISSGLGDKDGGGESSNSLSSLYSKWNNPVFVQPPMVGVDISSGQADGLAVKIHNILFPYRFSKAMIHSMKVIHQVDKKFLACLINTRDEEHAAHAETEGNLLVLVDQHAAHERVRLENLVADSYEDDPDVSGERRLCSSTILPPLEISVTEEELRLLRSCEAHLRILGLEVKFSQAADPQVFVGKVPLCFMEKESNELRRGRPSVIKPIVEEYLREQIELLRSTGRVRGTLPLTVLKVLASLACHGAIKFNDTLSKDECHSLVASLSSCQLPFQCAHGRPSIAPLVDVLHLDKDQKELQKPNLQKLRRMHKAWELYGNR
ncbi:DNA mismatch repair protein Mlh3 [Lates japonicus]|uniref:DNA mismatch repair protein Mlh3 n=1 Tax=Lates japonicus TaxID=270547 RepID=A0AAD3MZR0_LATJO|nr:DNA mismatch repair protein Mlh3 [Lates japonicus]